MRLTFSEMLKTSAYQRQASTASQVSIVIATLVCLYIIVFSDWGFGLWWILLIPTLWFVISVVVALPITLIRFWLASILQHNPPQARLTTGLVDIGALPLEVFIVYFGLRQLYLLLY